MSEFRAQLRMKPPLWLGVTVESVEACLSRRGEYVKLRFKEIPWICATYRTWRGNPWFIGQSVDLLTRSRKIDGKYYIDARIVESRELAAWTLINTVIRKPES
jgi:hypothetical protein